MLRTNIQDDIKDDASRELKQSSRSKSYEEDQKELTELAGLLPRAAIPSTNPFEEKKEDAVNDEIGNQAINDEAEHMYTRISTADDEEHLIDLTAPADVPGNLLVIQPREYYVARNLIDLNNMVELQNAAMSFGRQSAAKQDQLMEYYKSLALVSKKDSKYIAKQMNYLPYDPEPHLKTPFDALPDAKQKELLDYYVSQHRMEYSSIVVHGFLGYAGEFFYLYWDMLARMSVFERLFPGAPEAANKALNYTATLPIALANVTYWPLSEARSYMQNKMLFQKSFVSAVRENKFKTLMFMLYAFGGGYVEIVDINDDLNALTVFGKIPVETLLIYAAVAYYTAFQFADVIDKSKKYAAMPSLIKRAFDLSSDRSAEDRIADLFNGMHEAISVIERVFRMAYGGFEAGLQQSGSGLAYALGGLVGFGTAPIAYAIRPLPLRDMYNLDAFTDEEIDKATVRYNAKYAQSFIKGELKLFLTPSLLLIAPGAVWATSYATGAVDGIAAKLAVGTATTVGSLVALHAGLFLRAPAKRRAIVNEAANLQQPVPGSVVPNDLAKWISRVVNFFDQTSRVFSFGYSMQEMFPEVLSLDNKIGQDLMMTILFLDAFIALSAYIYQMDKSAEAYKGYSNRLFGKRLPRVEGGERLLDSRTNTPNPSDHEVEEMSQHDAAALLTGVPLSDESTSRFSCSIM